VTFFGFDLIDLYFIGVTLEAVAPVSDCRIRNLEESTHNRLGPDLMARVYAIDHVEFASADGVSGHHSAVYRVALHDFRIVLQTLPFSQSAVKNFQGDILTDHEYM